MLYTKNKSEDGFTLIEAAIASMIFGLLLTAFLRITMTIKINEERTQYFNAVNEAAAALENYAFLNGKYPIPAAINLPTNNINYGVSVDKQVAPLATTLPDFTAGECAANAPAVNGVFCRPGARNVNGTGGIGDIADETILIGSLPTTLLGMNSDESLDRYGGRFTYAISWALTNASSTAFDNNNGVIRVQTTLNDGSIVDAMTTTGDVHYVVLSHGNNQSGGLTGNGIASGNACNANDALEIENCDDDAIFHVLTTGNDTPGTENLNVLKTTLEVVGNTFDDALAFNNRIVGRLWTAWGTDRVNMTSGNDDGTTKIILGARDYSAAPLVMKNNVAARPQLWVNGGVRVEQALSQRLCDVSQVNCFRLEDITHAPGVVVNDEVSGTSKQLECINRGFKNVHMVNGKTSGQKRGSTGEANAECDIFTQVSNLNFLGVRDSSGVVCANGANGRDANGNLKCL